MHSSLNIIILMYLVISFPKRIHILHKYILILEVIFFRFNKYEMRWYSTTNKSVTL